MADSIGGEMMTVYKRDFKKTVWGWAKVEAKNVLEAQDKFDTCDFDDEHDVETDYEWEEIQKI